MDNEELLRTLQGMFEKNVQEVKRYTGVKVEDLQRQVKAVAEGHSLLNEKIDRLEGKVDRLDGKVDSLDGRMVKLEADMKGVKQDLATVKDYVIAVDDKLNKHDIILKRIK